MKRKMQFQTKETKNKYLLFRKHEDTAHKRSELNNMNISNTES